MSQETSALDTLRNRTFDEIAIGDQAVISRTLTSQDLALFAVLSGDGGEPAAGDATGKTQASGQTPSSAVDNGAQTSVAAGMWAGTWLAALLATQLPGPGTVYRRQQLRFLAPMAAGETITLMATVTAKDAGERSVVLSCTGSGIQPGQDKPRLLLEGEVEVIAPAQTMERVRTTLPDIHATTGKGTGLRRLL
ncbi:MAG: enoyl-CoA hydratase, partial [Lysobacterales bacterium]